MNISCVIMAGGKSSRMKTHDEKTIIPILGKPMIEYVIEAVLGSIVNEVVVTTSPTTLKTKKLLEKYDIKIIETAGKGYHEDLRELFKYLNFEIVLLISGDFPLINGEDINEIIKFYKNSKKPSLSVMASLTDFKKYKLKPTYVMEYEGKKLVPVGINIIDGRINANEWQEEAIMIVEKIQFLINVNTEEDLHIIENLLKGSN